MKIIGIEGIDGSGKSLQHRLLIDKLLTWGYRCTGMSFPIYDSFLGREIGYMLSGKEEVRADRIDPKSMALWYAADRMVQLKNFCQADWDILVLNRYTLSNAVYQSIRYGGDRYIFARWVYELEHLHLGLPTPDMYFVMDVDPDISTGNVEKKGHRDYVGKGADVYEQSGSMMAMARSLYKELGSNYENIRIIDCMSGHQMKTPDAIHQMLMKEMEHLLPGNRS